MKLVEIEQEALALPDCDRASLVAKLLDTLPPPGTDVPDEEVEQREREMDLRQMAAISHEEFVHFVQEQRGQISRIDAGMPRMTLNDRDILESH